MASESLLRRAEQMYGSELDTTDYAKLLTQPTVDVMTKNLEEQKKITDELINKMPAGISIDKIPEELRPMVTGWLTDNKAEYVKHAKVVGSGIASDDPRYLEALEGMNRIRSGFETLEADLAGLAENRKLSIENRHKKSKYSHLWQQTDHESFANGTIYGSINANGIGEGGKLSYTSNGEKKLVSDYGTFLTDGSGAVGVDALRKEVINNAQSGIKFEDSGISNMVTALVGQLGAKGIGDLMYSNPMYIDEYIRLNHGGITEENDKAAYDKLYEELKDEDLTEEFTSHLLGTEEKPGMLRNTHKAAFREYIPGGKGGGGGALTIPQQLEQAKAVKIDNLVQQRDASLLDINSIITGTSSNPLKVVIDGNEYVIQNIAGKGDLVVYERFPISDREYLRAMLYKYSYTDEAYGNPNLQLGSNKVPNLKEEQKRVQAINPPKGMIDQYGIENIVYDKDYGWMPR